MRSAFMKRLGVSVGALLLVIGTILSLPSLLAFGINHSGSGQAAHVDQFPVTVIPRERKIVENTEVNELLASPDSPLQAAVGNAGALFGAVLTWVAAGIANIEWYQTLAAAATGDRFVVITAGMRKEQVASAFGSALAWNAQQKKDFMTAAADAVLPLPEGSFAPGVYSVPLGTTPAAAQQLVNERFSTDVLSRYGTTTASVVPLEQALTVASLIQREAGGPEDMRLISGIIWNRLFTDMNLQIDATIQYAKANKASTKSWWPNVLPRDMKISSPYNTYTRGGLPPTPIASPSVAAIVAALNPRATTCLFYFHDSARRFHCSDTYSQHVALLKKFYGRGK